MKKNSLDKIIQKEYSDEEQTTAANMLLQIATRYHDEALTDPFDWSQRMALLLLCELNRVTK